MIIGYLDPWGNYSNPQIHGCIEAHSSTGLTGTSTTTDLEREEQVGFWDLFMALGT